MPHTKDELEDDATTVIRSLDQFMTYELPVVCLAGILHSRNIRAWTEESDDPEAKEINGLLRRVEFEVLTEIELTNQLRQRSR